MSQVLGLDNIPSLVAASTTQVTIAATNQGNPTAITIGGQQYVPSSTLTCTTSGTGAGGLDTGSLGAVGLYYVYAIRNTSTFVPALIASLTGPSAGPLMPSGYGTAYKLVGAFYSNTSNLVGAVVPITGPATTTWFDFTPVWSTLGGATFTSSVGSMRRNADTLELQMFFSVNGAGTGSSQPTVALPGSLVVAITDTNSGFNGSSPNGMGVSSFFTQSTITLSPLNVTIASSTSVQFVHTTGNNAGRFLVQSDLASGNVFGGMARFPIVGWNATLL